MGYLLEDTAYEAEVQHGINADLRNGLQHLTSVVASLVTINLLTLIGLGSLVVGGYINFWLAPELYTEVELATDALLRNGTAKAQTYIGTEALTSPFSAGFGVTK